jgi:hypothetical protein
LLFAENRKSEIFQQQSGAHGEQHGILLPRRHSAHPPEKESLETPTNNSQDDHDSDQTHEIIKLKNPVEIINDKTTDHEHLPMGKIQDVHNAEDQRNPKCDQRVVDGQDDPIDKNLFQRSTLLVTLTNGTKPELKNQESLGFDSPDDSLRQGRATSCFSAKSTFLHLQIIPRCQRRAFGTFLR